MPRFDRVLAPATTQQRLQDLRRQEVRARSCAALVFAFHGGLRPVPAGLPRPAAPALRRRFLSRLPALPAEVADEPIDEAPARSAYEILKWVGMIAAIAAPWVLLLTG